jgi:hypothetical protein
MMTEKVKRKLTAILSADVKGYSRLMGADEAGYYVYDLKSGRAGVLKRFGTGDIDGFFSKLLLASLGHGNFTGWE